MEKRLQEGDFDFEDFLDQLKQIKRLGPITDLLGMIPGMNRMVKEVDPRMAEDSLKKTEAIINSMTRHERRKPDLLNGSRRRRIATGSGTEPHEVKQFLAQFDQVRALMRQMAKMSIFQRIKMMTGLGKMGAFQPGSNMLKTKVGTGHRKSAKERAEDRKRKRKQDKRKKRKDDNNPDKK